MSKRKSDKKNTIKINMEDVESRKALPEGDYLFEIDEVEVKTADNSGADYLAFTMKVADGPNKGSKVWHNCSLQPQALFNLKSVMEACGMEAEGTVEFDPADMIGMTFGGTVAMEKYEGKERPRLVEFFSEEELDSTEEPADEPEEAPAKPASKKKAKKKEEPEFEVGDKVTFEDDDGEEVTGKITEIDGDSVTVKVGKDEWELEVSDITKA